MQFKGIEKINEFLTNWFFDHGFEIVATMGNEYSIDLGTNVLRWAPYYDEDGATIFLEEVKKDFPEIIACPDPLLAIFHEIGHAETECEWDDEDWDEYDEFVKNCKDNRTYFRHPIEWRATEWGCKFILDNYKEVRSFWCKFVSLMCEFYDLNNIEP